MTNNFDDPFANNLVGLWDFLNSGPRDDTGLADGIAQNGDTRGDVNFSGGRAHFDGHGDVFDVAGDAEVHGNDAPFDLSEGTIAVEFSQDQHVGSSPDTIVTRGEYADRGSEGYFEIRVTKDGRVEVQHCANGADVVLRTDADFFDPCDDLKVTYTWSETEGGTFKVENLTENTTQSIDFSTTGLTMDIGDNDDEAFSFGARERDDGQYDHFFDGSIDYVAIYDRDLINNQPEIGDGIVSGTDDGEVIDADYDGDPEGDKIDAGDAIIPGEGPDDDIVDARGGDDTVLSGVGDDEVYAGAGDDDVEGGAGNDLIFGDGELGDGVNLIRNGSFEDTTGMTQTGYGFVGTGAVPGWTEGNGAEIDFHNDGRGGVDASDGSNWLDLSASPSQGIIGQDVAGVVDGQTYVLSFDVADGQGVPGGENLVDVFWGGELVARIDPASSDMDDFNFVVVGGAGNGSDRLEFANVGGNDNFGASVDNVRLVSTSDVSTSPGDDTLEGGDGDDILIGQQGEDHLGGGEGDDTIDGGDDDDDINGGRGSDSIFGGDGADVITAGDPDDNFLVDKGYPNLFPGEEGTPATENDRDFVDGGAGNDTISTGDDRDTIVGGTGDDRIDGGIDDDEITGDEGADRIVGGEGNDVIEGGIGNDTIFAGNDPDLGLDILNIEDDGSNPFGPDLRPDNGRDTVFGGEGNDVIFGADDDDTLFGDEGDDTIDGEIDDDLIDGGTGDDSLRGGQGDDTVEGGDGSDTIDGGTGNDDLSGGADADRFINVNAGDTVDGGGDVTTGTDFDVLDLTGSEPEGGSFTIDITGPDSNGNGFDGVVNYFDSDGNAAGSLTFTEIEGIIPCFTPGTMIATATGERLVQDLAVGDRIITRDNGIQEIRWIGKRDMNGQDLARAAHLRPVLIRQGALGKGLPERDMLVSPQHRVLMSSDKTALYFDEAEVLVAAKHLTDMEGIDIVEVSNTTYIHVMFDQHEVILSDGSWTESFQPGDQTLASMGDGPRAEILELFPELKTENGISAYTAARRSLKKHEAKLLTQ